MPSGFLYLLPLKGFQVRLQILEKIKPLSLQCKTLKTQLLSFVFCSCNELSGALSQTMVGKVIEAKFIVHYVCSSSLSSW